MNLKVGRAYFARDKSLVLITAYDPRKKFNKYSGYIIREDLAPLGQKSGVYTRLTPLMSWGESGKYWMSGWPSKHDLKSYAPPHLQPLLSLDVIKIV